MPDADTKAAHPTVRRIIVFRVIAGLTGALFMFLATSNALAPWVAITANPDDPQPEMHRWFTAMSGATDLIAAGCLLALAHRPRGRELLALNLATGIAIAAVVIVPFTPAFVILLLFFVPVLVAYPYRRDLALPKNLRPRPPLARMAVAASAAALLLATAGLAVIRQISATDSAASVGSWAEYAEHAAGLAVASILAVTHGPGWRVLCGLCALAWLYLGLVAAVVLPHQQGSWGHAGGVAALAVGIFYASVTVVGRQPSPPTVRTPLAEDPGVKT